MPEQISLIVEFLATFALIWWIVFLMIMPIRTKIPDEIGLGHASSAPENPRIRLKIILTTVISSVISMILVYLIKNDIIDLYKFFNQ